MERGVATRAAGEVYQWAKINEPDLFQLIYGELEGMFKRNSRYQSILEMYQEINNPEVIKMHQKMYINSARLKSMEEYIGLDWLLWWYQRNLIIFTNVTELIETDDERILLIIGGAHVEILNNFLRDSDLVEVEMAHDFLS